jgi:hypothetical protein
MTRRAQAVSAVKGLAVSVLLLLTQGNAFASQITWRVEAGFAPFAHLKNPDAVSQAWLPPRQDTHIVDFQAWYRHLYETGKLKNSPYAEWLDPGRKTESPWNAEKGQHKSDYANPNSVTIRARLSGHTGRCIWHIRRQGQLEPNSRKANNCEDFAQIKKVRLAGDELVATTSRSTFTTPIHVEHLVVVGLGDSYASGEGNPDIPSQWKARQAPVDTFEWLQQEGKDSLLESEAKWLDPDCHRSFFSYQTFTALRLAAENPHRLVTFLHYACSGAEVFDGLVAPQYRPPGMTSSCVELIRQHGAKRTHRSEEGCFLRQSQIASMMTDLCARSGEARAATEIRERVRKSIDEEPSLRRLENYDKGPGVDAVTCSKPRQPDLVLLSIGGNDIGFAQLVAWAIMPHKARARLLPGNEALFAWIRSDSVVCPAIGRSGGERCKVLDYHLAQELPFRLRMFKDILEAVLPSDTAKSVTAKVVLNSYPVAATDHSTPNPQLCFDEGGCNPLNGWDGARFILSSKSGFLRGAARCDRPDRGWHFNVREGEIDALVFKNTSAGQATVPMLQETLEDVARDLRFSFANLTGTALDGHGFCRLDAGDMPIALPSRAPLLWKCRSSSQSASSSEISGNPACWEAYRPAGRFIRTINDSLMTMTSHRKDGLSGAFHPTAQGHAAIAEAAWRTVERVVREERSLPR